MTKPILFPLAICLAVIFGLSACGGGGSSDTITDTNTGGGTSIGILLSDITDAVIDDNTITSGNGGDRNGVNDKGAAGGNGGGGGMGGAGGQGGAGGPSYGILVNRDIAPIISNNILTTGNGGAPGVDGAGSGGGAIGGRNGRSSTGRLGGTIPLSSRGSTGTPAEGGWAYNIYDIDSADGLVPALNNNTFTVGNAGTRGNAGDKNF